MATAAPEDNQLPPIQQEGLRDVVVEGNLTIGNIHQSITYTTHSDSQLSQALPLAEIPIDELVQQVRKTCYVRLEAECGKMRLLNRQVPIDDLYTDVYILEDIPNQRFVDIRDRVRDFNPTADKFEHFYLGKVYYERIPGLNVVTIGCKLMCLGAPGSGKTTYLSYIATQCNARKLQSDCVPIFIRLVEFADFTKNQSEHTLTQYIQQKFEEEGIRAPGIAGSLLSNGRCLVLLDGLDEVPQKSSERVLAEVRKFCRSFHKNSIVVTCRTNALSYSFTNIGFTEIIVADFNQQQIETFAYRWFTAFTKGDVSIGNANAKRFLNELNNPANKRIRDLAVTPILLNLSCLIFHDTGHFPTNRAKLYQQGLNTLLQEWDLSRGIERKQIYRNLAIRDREKLLSYVAAKTFVDNRYFFEQQEIEEHIKVYLCSLFHIEYQEIQNQSEEILRDIELQHGLVIERSKNIYSFSHLTFQEYLTASFFVKTTPNGLKELVSYVTERRWREVFLLVAETLDEADNLIKLMKTANDFSLENKKFQDFLEWLDQKSTSLSNVTPFKLSSLRAFCFVLDPDVASAIDIDLDSACDAGKAFDENFDSVDEIEIDLNLCGLFDQANDIENCPELLDYFKHISSLHPNLAADVELFEIKSVLPDLLDKKSFKEWWKLHGEAWIESLRSWMVKYRNIGYIWNFDEQDKEKIELYHYVNELIWSCLEVANVSKQLRVEIEETLMLPLAKSVRYKL